MKLLYIFFFMIFFHSGFGQIQSLKLESSTKIDSTYYVDNSNKLIVKINRDTRIDDYTIKGQDNYKLYLKPNLNHNHSISVDYKFLGFSLKLPQNWLGLQPETGLKGESKSFDVNFTFFFNRWIQSFGYNSIKGYYVQNTGDFIPNWKEGVDLYTQLPYYEVQRMSGSTGYIFNNSKFSYRSFFNQTQMQTKSAGSLITFVNYEYLIRKNKEKHNSDFDLDKVFTSIASIGYQYNWVISRNFNFSGGFFPGFGFNYSKSKSPDTNEMDRVWNTTSQLNFNVNLNYRWRNLFCGFQMSSLNYYTKEYDLSVKNSINYNNIYLGYQFDAPKTIEKPINWIEKKIF